MTLTLLTKTYNRFQVEEPAPGECLRDCRETWSKMTNADKWRLGEIIGFDHVMRIEMRYLAG